MQEDGIGRAFNRKEGNKKFFTRFFENLKENGHQGNVNLGAVI
jgi:hypothetical protein